MGANILLSQACQATHGRDGYDVGVKRKQLYLDEGQDQALKQRAKELGVSEAEVVRRALDEALSISAASRGSKRREELLQSFFDDVDQFAGNQGLPADYRFDREALYEDDERFTKWNERQ